MRMKLIPLFLAISILSISGCKSHGDKIKLPEPRPLGSEFDIFQPTLKPVEDSENTRIIEPSGILTLRQALALALMHNPRLKAYSWKVRETEAMQLEASLRPNPELQVEVENIGGPGEKREFDSALLTIQLSRLIELGGKRSKRERVALLDNILAGWDYETEKLDLLTEVAKIFVDVLAAQQKLAFTEELLLLSQEVLSVVERRIDAGKDSPLEKTKAAVAHSTIKIEHQRAIRELEATRKRLSSAWCIDEPLFTSAAGHLNIVYPVPPIDDLSDFIEENPEIIKGSLEIDKQRAALDLEKARAFPDVTLSGGLQRFNDTSEKLFVFGISIPLQFSNRNQAGKLLAAYKLAGTRQVRKAEETRIHMELESTYNDLSSAYMEATELREHVLHGAQSVFDASMLSYKEGKLDYLNVLDAQRTLFEVKKKYIEVLAEYHKAKADVEQLIGRSIDNSKYLKSEDYE